MNVTIVAHPETGAMFTETKNSEWVKCQLQSEEVVVNNGVISLQKRVAFPLISAKVLPILKKLKSGDKFPVPGKIIRSVTSTPQYEGHKPVINPSTGEVMGYYQSYTFTTDMAAYDVDERTTVAPKTPEIDPEILVAKELANA